MRINLLSNIAKVPEVLDEMTSKVAVQAARSAINRSLDTGRTETYRELSKRLRIKMKLVREKVRVQKAKGGSFRSIVGNIWFNDNPLNLIDFVKGNKNVIKQKGIPVKKRRKLKVELIKGRTTVLPTAFIQKKHTKQVFKSGSSGFYKQSAPSVGRWVEKPYIKPEILKKMQESFERSYENQLSWRMEKLQEKLNGKLSKI